MAVCPVRGVQLTVASRPAGQFCGRILDGATFGAFFGLKNSAFYMYYIVADDPAGRTMQLFALVIAPLCALFAWMVSKAAKPEDQKKK